MRQRAPKTVKRVEVPMVTYECTKRCFCRMINKDEFQVRLITMTETDKPKKNIQTENRETHSTRTEAMEMKDTEKDAGSR